MDIKINNENTLIIKNNEQENCLFRKDLEDIDKRKIEKVILPNTLEAIGYETFINFENLKEINFPSSLEEIGENAFLYCFSLKHIELNEGLRCIYSGAFDYCDLEELYIPSTVESIYSCVAGNQSLKKITISKDNKIYSDMDCNVVYNKITNELIQGCNTSTIPESTKILGEECFLSINNEQLTLPKNIEQIRTSVFEGMKAKKIFINCSTDLFYRDDFVECANLKEIYVANIDKESEFYKKYKNKICLMTLDTLIDQGKSFKEINNILKESKQLR